MKRPILFSFFYLATFLQAGTYGLTFLLPRLFEDLGGNEKHVGYMLLITTFTTLLGVYYSGHITDRIGRTTSLGASGFVIAVSLFLYGNAEGLGVAIAIASGILGLGWGIFYTIGPVVLSAITEADQRIRIFSLNSIFIMAGFGLSPVFASMLESRGFLIAHAFTTMGVVCIISGCLFLFIHKYIEKLNTQSNENTRSRLSPGTILDIFQTRARIPLIMVCLGASVFAGVANFQTVYADFKTLEYADFFLYYTVTVVICRIVLAGYSGGSSPYKTIALLQYIMALSIAIFIFSGSSNFLYIIVAVLFGLGYGASYPILVAMAANDAHPEWVAQTLQLFALSYFVGLFGFPMVAGWIIVELNISVLLSAITLLALIEATLALKRGWEKR